MREHHLVEEFGTKPESLAREVNEKRLTPQSGNTTHIHILTFKVKKNKIDNRIIEIQHPGQSL